jgi:hypothetical protein
MVAIGRMCGLELLAVDMGGRHGWLELFTPTKFTGVCSTSTRRPFKGLSMTHIFFLKPSGFVPELAKKAEGGVLSVAAVMEFLLKSGVAPVLLYFLRSQL